MRRAQSVQEAHDRWPVAERDVWSLGPHRVACGDLRTQGERFLLEWSGAVKPRMFYSDPPWTPGIEKKFRAWAGKQSGNFPDLLAGVAVLAAEFEHAYVEIGEKAAPLMRALLTGRIGMKLHGEWGTTYARRTIPCRLLYCSQADVPPIAEGTAAGLDATETPLWAICRTLRAGEAVFDPCLGLGTTLMHAHSSERVCVGMELNPSRLAWSIELAARRGVTPMKIGELR